MVPSMERVFFEGPASSKRSRIATAAIFLLMAFVEFAVGCYGAYLIICGAQLVVETGQEIQSQFSLWSWATAEPVILVFPAAVFYFLLLAPILTVRKAMRTLSDRRWRNLIDDCGISTPSLRLPWRTIRRIWGQIDDKDRRRVNLRFSAMRLRLFPFFGRIWTATDFDEGKCRSLLANLQPFLAERHPHVKLSPPEKK